jgi:hypothetical protein
MLKDFIVEKWFCCEKEFNKNIIILETTARTKMSEFLFKDNQHDVIFTNIEVVCPGCELSGLLLFYDMQDVPVYCTSIMSTKEEAVKSPRGEIRLAFCEKCGFITNIAFDSEILKNSGSYEDQQSFSPTFKSYAEKLVDSLIRKYNLYGKNVVEIGCGKGDFLELLCKAGNNKGIGIDPLSQPERLTSEASSYLTFIKEYYSEKHGQYLSDLLVCRHTLEHIYSTSHFMKTLRRSIDAHKETIVFVEVPDTTRILSETAFWDIYYEHCSHFSPGSLARLFRHCGFEVIDLYRAYNNQYLLLEAKAATQSSSDVFNIEENPEDILHSIKLFLQRLDNMRIQWKQKIEQTYKKGKRAVIWGSGSKCVSFMTTLGIRDEIEYIVDINPYRQGKFIPAVGKEIVSPKFIKEYNPDLVIVMNSIYLNEIRKMINDMDLNPEVVSF